jgi:hypothetical protein
MDCIPESLRRLTLDAAADENAIRRAYARELKLLDRANDITGFQDLRAAYEAALTWASHPRSKQSVFDDALSLHAQPEESQPDAADLGPAQAPSQPYLQSTVPEHLIHAGDKWPGEVDAEQRAEPALQQVGDAMAAELMGKLAALADNSGPGSEQDAQDLLSAYLQDERLSNMAAQHAFEFSLVCTLISGWRKGHELLFPAAARMLRWQEDRSRLPGFGFPGLLLEQAVVEMVAQQAQDNREGARQRKAIRRVRNPAPPSHLEVFRHFPPLLVLRQRYPVWLRLVMDQDAFNQWEALNESMPARTRRAFQLVKDLSTLNTYFDLVERLVRLFETRPKRMFFAAAILIAIVTGISENHGRRRPDLFIPVVLPADGSEADSPSTGCDCARRSAARIVWANVRFRRPENLQENPPVEVEISLFADGFPASTTILKASGVPGFDEVVLNGIRITFPFPPDLPRKFRISFRPKDF